MKFDEKGREIHDQPPVAVSASMVGYSAPSLQEQVQLLVVQELQRQGKVVPSRKGAKREADELLGDEHGDVEDPLSPYELDYLLERMEERAKLRELSEAPPAPAPPPIAGAVPTPTP